MEATLTMDKPNKEEKQPVENERFGLEDQPESDRYSYLLNRIKEPSYYGYTYKKQKLNSSNLNKEVTLRLL